MFQPVATPLEVDVAFQYAGFYGIEVTYYPPRTSAAHQAEVYPDGYWLISCHRNGTRESVIREVTGLLDDLGLRSDEELMVDTRFPNQPIMRSVTISLSTHVLEQPEASETAKTIVATLLEDIDADLPSHKSEVRILPTDNPNRFDVTLLTGFDPIYIGTIVNQGRSWKPVEVMPGVGRQLRTKLHLVGPDKESMAMTMVEILRPIWKRKVTQHLLGQMESEEVDPKGFVQQKIGHDIDIKRVIETNYPDVEILEIKAEPGYRLRYEVMIRSKDPAAHPLWHSPIYAMILDLEVKLADVYNWKLRPYANQENYPEYRRTGKPVGIKPIGIAYDTATGQPGVIKLLIDFNILKRDDSHGYFEEPDWGTPYGLRNEDLAADIAKEAAKAERPESPEQAEAGNYRKGHISLFGFQIAIENAKGSTRSGTNKNGTPWKVTMPAHYGYIKGTQGKDKDHLDVYIGPKPDGFMVYVVNQRTFEGAFDEHKIMLGFHSKADAIEVYDRAFSGNLGPRLRQSVVSTTIEKFKEWVATGNTKVPFGGVAESLLEADEEFGLEHFKALVMRAAEPKVPDGTEFHIGFAVITSNQYDIEARANDDAIEVDWDAVNAAIPIIERNAVNALTEQGIRCSPEGHNGTDELVGSAWVETGTGAINILKEFIDRDEPFSTASGTIDHIQQGLAVNVYRGVPPTIAGLIDVSIDFFDLDKLSAGIEESDIKSLAMRAPMRDPRVWGDLKLGDVVFVPETGAYQRIEGYKEGYPGNYQDETGALIYDGRPRRMLLYSEFGPCYAYGHFVQHLSHHPLGGLLGAQLVELDDTSDEALWALVDEEMYRNGTTPEELAQSRAAHQARQAARTPEEADAQRRYDELMGRVRVPEPPVEESDELDSKAFALRTGQRLDSTPVEITEYAYNQIGQLSREDLTDFYRKADRIIGEMVAQLEKATGRRALEGLHGYLRGFMPEPGSKITRKNAREVVYVFNGGSKKVKV